MHHRSPGGATAIAEPRRRLRAIASAALTYTLLGFPVPAFAQPSEQALSLRNLGVAQLENAKDAEAEATYRSLVRLVPRDPLPHANLAIALLRQQEHDDAATAVESALRLAPGRADLLAIQGDILAWSGENERALRAYAQAFAAEPTNPEIAHALFRHAGILREGSVDAQRSFDEALLQLARLRPENLVILLENGQRAIERGDRAGATQAYLRIRELTWALEPDKRRLAESARVLPKILDALENNQLDDARIPALQLGNVLRSSGRYRTSLVELYEGIQGIPIDRFVGEPAPTPFGSGVDITFSAELLSDAAGTGHLVAMDWTGDGSTDIAWTRSDASVQVRPSGGTPSTLDATARTLHPIDLDNDAQLDLLLLGAGEDGWVRGTEGGGFDSATALPAVGLDPTVRSIDFDSDGDLDLLTLTLRAGSEDEYQLGLLRNDGTGKLSDVGTSAFPRTEFNQATDVVVGDLDDDGDHDVLVATVKGITWFDNLRQGAFSDRSRSAGLARAPGARAMAAGDLDNDGAVDLVLAGVGDDHRSVLIYANRGGVFRRALDLEVEGAAHDVVLFDADNDGFLDLATAGEQGIQAFLRRDADYEPVAPPTPPDATPRELSSLAADDADGDGDLDLIASGRSGLLLYSNRGGNENSWIRVTLRGLTTGNDKNSAFGVGARIEIKAGGARQVREARGTTTHFGLGSAKKPDLLRVVWNNGVPQNRLAPSADQVIVEEQVLKGSCPFLYTWTGEDREIEFVTDLLWGAPVGMPVAEGVYAEADPHELVVVRGAKPRDGFYDLRITEELWEAAYFDTTKLWVVDHPEGTEATSSLRVFPGPAPAREEWPDRVLLAGNLESVRAWDGTGREVTEQVARRDDVYADGYELGDYQGISEAWAFTFDLGAAPAGPIRLVLDGWIFPSDASINVAASQRQDLEFTFTRLEVLTEHGWQPLVDPMGFPAGKTKTTVVDTPPLPAGAHKLRIVTSRWLHWDRLAWTPSARDEEARVVAQLTPTSADLGYRGFSQIVRKAPNAPHEYDYDRLLAQSPWMPFPGRYTAFGDVREALEAIDGNVVVMAAGDELRLLFDARTLPPVPTGFVRTLLLESYGWDKDADRNTLDGASAWPLPDGTLEPGGKEQTERTLTRVVSSDSL